MTERPIIGIAGDGSVAFAPDEPAADSIIERAARAVWAEVGPSNSGWTFEQDREDCEEIARAVLQAIREPSEGMITEGAYTIPCGGGGEIGPPNERDALNCWQAMIDAALEEG